MAREIDFRRLNFELRRLCQQEDVRARIKRVFGASAITRETSIRRGRCHLRFDIDFDKVGRVTGVIHELLHHHFKARFEGLEEDVEEAMVVGLEHAFVDGYLEQDERRYNKWRTIIRDIVT